MLSFYCRSILLILRSRCNFAVLHQTIHKVPTYPKPNCSALQMLFMTTATIYLEKSPNLLIFVFLHLIFIYPNKVNKPCWSDPVLFRLFGSYPLLSSSTYPPLCLFRTPQCLFESCISVVHTFTGCIHDVFWEFIYFAEFTSPLI